MSVYGEFDFEGWVRGLMQGTEELLWTGRLDRHTGFSVWTHIVVPSACLWLYFLSMCLIPLLILLHDKPNGIKAVMFAIVPLYFFIILALVAVRVAHSVLRANTYYYALTNQRALIFQRSWGESYASHYFSSSSDVQRLVRKNRQVHIVFGNSTMREFLRRLKQSAYWDYFDAALGGGDIVFRRLTEADANQVLGHIAALRSERQLGAGSVGD